MTTECGEWACEAVRRQSGEKKEEKKDGEGNYKRKRSCAGSFAVQAQKPAN